MVIFPGSFLLFMTLIHGGYIPYLILFLQFMTLINGRYNQDYFLEIPKIPLCKD